jgi:hypothetical protein
MILAAFTKVLHSSHCPEIYINNTVFVGERGVGGGGGGVMTIWVRNEAICLCLELDSDTRVHNLQKYSPRRNNLSVGSTNSHKHIFAAHSWAGKI